MTAEQALIAEIKTLKSGILEVEELRCPICGGTGYRDPDLEWVLDWLSATRKEGKQLYIRLVRFSEDWWCGIEEVDRGKNLIGLAYSILAPTPFEAALLCMKAVLEAEK